jgi:hypothetical protein
MVLAFTALWNVTEIGVETLTPNSLTFGFAASILGVALSMKRMPNTPRQMTRMEALTSVRLAESPKTHRSRNLPGLNATPPVKSQSSPHEPAGP